VLDLIEDACDGLLEHVSSQVVSPTAAIKGGRR
jgi:hypothetical protein